MDTIKKRLKKEMGLRLKTLRKTLDLSQAQFAKKLYMNRPAYSKSERGESYANMEMLYTLCTEFNTSLDWLIANKGQMVFENQESKEQDTIEHLNEETRELLYLMEHVPLVRHEVMGFFQRFKIANREEIDHALQNLNQEPDSLKGEPS